LYSQFQFPAISVNENGNDSGERVRERKLVHLPAPRRGRQALLACRAVASEQREGGSPALQDVVAALEGERPREPAWGITDF